MDYGPYRWMGFTEVGQVEVHRGEGSEVLVWWASVAFLIALSCSMLMILLGVQLGILDHPN